MPTTPERALEKTPLKTKTYRRRLWIGGSSGLARTYWNAFPEEIVSDGIEWIFLGHEKYAPSWMLETMSPRQKSPTTTITYHSLDLRRVDSDALTELLRLCHDVQDVIISIRPRLVSSDSFAQAWTTNQQMLQGLERILHALVQNHNAQSQPLRILHLSSIAAIHHVQEQKLRSESDPEPASDELPNPYDRFKRASEEMILKLPKEYNNKQKNTKRVVQITNIRMGAIFSDDPRCIQCNAMQLQSRIGCYLHLPIDCNSSRNVASLIHLLLASDQPWPRPVYYYTRPIRFHPQPVAYGSYLQAYRRANDISWAALWIPVSLVHAVVGAFHTFATAIISPRGRSSSSSWWRKLLERYLYLEHVDYLLQVTIKEHSFDLTAVQTDFPKLLEMEESIYECFRRRRKLLKL